MLTAANLDAVAHGFSTRSHDDTRVILPGAALLLAKQIHSAQVVQAGEWGDTPPEADAIVTDRPGRLIGIVTADCAPVLLADHQAGVIGAAHAGWRGAVGGVIENTVAAMVALGAVRARIAAAIGPTIAQASYEVDAAMRDRFTPGAHRFFSPGAPGHWQFDLPGFVSSRLAATGVASIEDLAEDTYSQPDRFYSFRRATHRGEPTGGRQISVIGLVASP